jgi:hypothetical protein
MCVSVDFESPLTPGRIFQVILHGKARIWIVHFIFLYMHFLWQSVTIILGQAISLHCGRLHHSFLICVENITPFQFHLAGKQSDRLTIQHLIVYSKTRVDNGVLSWFLNNLWVSYFFIAARKTFVSQSLQCHALPRGALWCAKVINNFASIYG